MGFMRYAHAKSYQPCAHDSSDALMRSHSCPQALTLTPAATARPSADAPRDCGAGTMVASNLRLVVAMAARHARRASACPPLSDLIQEGAVGLVRAAEKFDPSRGFRFST
jgi:DNA-directed RNA polymerase sigma subunit (sigma70/sigma32)